MGDDSGRRRSLADKLNHLFATRLNEGGQEYSNEQVAAAITSAGEPISMSYIWQLRKGRKDNPTFKHIQALSGFFGVPVGYFFDDTMASRVDEQLAELRDLQARKEQASATDQGQLMAMRAGELSEQGRQQVMDLLDVVYRLERAERGTPTG